jgi:outer membrane protein
MILKKRTRLVLRSFWFAALVASGSATMGQETWTLQRCIDHAFEHNLTLQEARLGQVSAAIGEEAAVGAFLPSLNGSASHGYNFGQTIDPFTNQFATARIRSNSFGLSSGLMLFNGFTNHLNLERARLAALRAEVGVDQVGNNVALTIAAAYLNVLFQDEFIAVAEVNLLATKRQAQRVSRLVEAGAAAPADLLDVEAQLAADQAQLVATENAAYLARLNLTQLLQLPSSEARNFQVARPSDSDLERLNVPGSPDAAVQHALSNFPEIRAAEYAVEDALIAERLAAAGRMPRAFMSYSMGTGYSGARQTPIGNPTTEEISLGTININDTLSFLLTTEQTYYENYETVAFGNQVRDNRNQSLFFSLSVPIFNGFSVRSNMKRAEVERLRADYRLEQAEQTLTQTVEQAWADALAAKSTLEAQDRALAAAELAFANAETRFEAGTTTALDYADSRARLDAARVNRLRALYDLAFKSRILDFYAGAPLTFR